MKKQKKDQNINEKKLVELSAEELRNIQGGNGTSTCFFCRLFGRVVLGGN